MRLLSILFLACLFVLDGSHPTKADTYYLDVSNKQGFQYNGAASVYGNGVVALSQKYTAGLGDTVDFGTAIFAPRVDGRGCLPFGSCWGAYSFQAFFLTNGSGGLDAAPFDIYSPYPNFVSCDIDDPCTVHVRLLFQLPADANGIQFLLQGGFGRDGYGLTIEPSVLAGVPEASTWAMLLLGFCGLSVLLHRRRADA